MAHRPTWVIPLGLLPTGAFPLQLGGTPQQVHDNILHSFDAHAGDEPLKDDLTLLVIGRGAGAGKNVEGAARATLDDVLLPASV